MVADWLEEVGHSMQSPSVTELCQQLIASWSLCSNAE